MTEVLQNVVRGLAVFLIAISLSNGVIAQDWAPIGAKWWYHASPFSMFDPVSFTTIESIGDTIVLGKNCRVLKRNYGCSDGVGVAQEEYLYLDSNILYRYHPYRDLFTILYDYNANEGDSWWVYPVFLPADSFMVTVDSTDSIVINFDTLKVLHITNWGSPWGFAGMLVEKLGLIGPDNYSYPYFFPQYGACDPHAGPLRCYQDPALGMYQRWDSIGCDSIYYVIGLHEVEDSSHNLIEFLNVINGEILININCRGSDYPNNFTLEIYGVAGRKLLVKEISCGVNTIPNTGLTSGMFVLKLTSPESIIARKFLINK